METRKVISSIVILLVLVIAGSTIWNSCINNSKIYKAIPQAAFEAGNVVLKYRLECSKKANDSCEIAAQKIANEDSEYIKYRTIVNDLIQKYKRDNIQEKAFFQSNPSDPPVIILDPDRKCNETCYHHSLTVEVEQDELFNVLHSPVSASMTFSLKLTYQNDLIASASSQTTLPSGDKLSVLNIRRISNKSRKWKSCSGNY